MHNNFYRVIKKGDKMKNLVIILSILFVGVGIVVLFLYLKLHTIIEQGIKRIGPKVLKTSVGLDKAKVSLFSGQGKLLNLSVGNPAGFTSSYLLKVKKMAIKFEPMSLFKDMVIIDEIYIDSPYIVYEYRGKKSNLEVFQKNIAGETKVSNNKTKGVISKKKTQKHILIRDLIIRNAQVEAIFPDLGLKKQVILKEIHLKNLGGKDKSQKQIFSYIIKSVVSQILPTIAPTVEALKANIKQIKGKIKEQVKQGIKDLKKGVVDKKKVNTKVNNLRKVLNNFFHNK